MAEMKTEVHGFYTYSHRLIAFLTQKRLLGFLILPGQVPCMGI